MVSNGLYMVNSVRQKLSNIKGSICQQMDALQGKTDLEMDDDQGYPYFRKSPYIAFTCIYKLVTVFYQFRSGIFFVVHCFRCIHTFFVFFVCVIGYTCINPIILYHTYSLYVIQLHWLYSKHGYICVRYVYYILGDREPTFFFYTEWVPPW